MDSINIKQLTVELPSYKEVVECVNALIFEGWKFHQVVRLRNQLVIHIEDDADHPKYAYLLPIKEAEFCPDDFPGIARELAIAANTTYMSTRMRGSL